MEPKISGNVDAKVGIAPRRSQIQVFVYGTGALLFALICCLFLWYGKPQWWVPGIISFTFLISGMICFFASFRSSELFNAGRTEVTVTQNQMSVSADPRLPGHSDLIRSVTEVFTALSHQKPLPYADGLVDEQGNVINNSEAQARAVIDSANAEAAHRVNHTLEMLASGRTKGLQNPARNSRTAGSNVLGNKLDDSARYD